MNNLTPFVYTWYIFVLYCFIYFDVLYQFCPTLLSHRTPLDSLSFALTASPLTGCELKPNRPSGHGKEKKRKNDFVHRSKTAKKDLKNKVPKKKVPLRLELFFLRILELFFLGLDGNRFCLADLGGVEPPRKLIRQILVPGRGLEVCCVAVVQRLLPRANVHESCMLVGPSTRGQTGVGAPRTGYPAVHHPRGQQGQERSCCQEYRIFFLTFFCRICSKNIHD